MKYLVLAVLGLAMAVGLSLWAFNYGGGPHPESVSAGMAKMTLHFTDDKVFVQDLAQVDALLQQRDPHQLALRDTRKTLTELVQARDRAVLAAARQPRPKAFDPAPLLPHLEVLLSTCGREEAALAALEKQDGFQTVRLLAAGFTLLLALVAGWEYYQQRRLSREIGQYQPKAAGLSLTGQVHFLLQEARMFEGLAAGSERKNLKLAGDLHNARKRIEALEEALTTALTAQPPPVQPLGTGSGNGPNGPGGGPGGPGGGPSKGPEKLTVSPITGKIQILQLFPSEASHLPQSGNTEFVFDELAANGDPFSRHLGPILEIVVDDYDYLERSFPGTRHLEVVGELHRQAIDNICTLFEEAQPSQFKSTADTIYWALPPGGYSAQTLEDLQTTLDIVLNEKSYSYMTRPIPIGFTISLFSGQQPPRLTAVS
ncbi:MAG: hypothetical protein K1Y36_29365 [Blastocatellia bacterium]|nr:hypothetical protein [Blastocatellia bacterium]